MLAQDVVSDTKNKIEIHPPAGIGAKTVIAVIPAYNEARSIYQVVLNMRRYATKVLVVDDGSSDNTAELAMAAGALVIKHAQNQGKGAALRTGFQTAAKLNPDVVVTIDADGQHLPEETIKVITPVLTGQADLVVGSRYLKHTSTVPYHRVCGHYFFKLVINRLAGVSLTDTQSGFRAFSPRALRAISFQSNGFGVESEMQFQARKFRLKVTEVPITVRYYKETKRSAYWQGVTVLSQVLRLTLHYRPAMIYSLAGVFFSLLLASLTGGVLWAANLTETYNQTNLYYLFFSAPILVILLTLFTRTVRRPGPPLLHLSSPEPELK